MMDKFGSVGGHLGEALIASGLLVALLAGVSVEVIVAVYLALDILSSLAKAVGLFLGRLMGVVE